MPYLPRIIEPYIVKLFENPSESRCLILAGIVGCGKTTLAASVLRQMEDRYATFTWTSDDVQMRRRMSDDTTSIHRMIRSQTTRPALVFIDEIQKCEEAFDAIKYAFDQGGISFIISGSNPGFLNTTARKRLQRRARFETLHPFSLSEIVSHETGGTPPPYDRLVELVGGQGWQWIRDMPPMDLTPSIRKIMENYVRFGGLPGVYRQDAPEAKLAEIQSVAERGFYPLSDDLNALADIVRITLAEMNSREFTYKTLFQRARTDKRYKINAVVDDLINHGYLLKKTPRLFHESKASYLFVLSWIDPGFIHYFTGRDPWEDARGPTVESVVHAALARMAAMIPVRTAISYFKPYTLDVNKKVKYKPGEIDFLFEKGASIVPIEVKTTADIGSVDTGHLEIFLKERGSPYAVVFYGGVPYVDEKRRIVYYPVWWM